MSKERFSLGGFTCKTKVQAEVHDYYNEGSICCIPSDTPVNVSVFILGNGTLRLNVKMAAPPYYELFAEENEKDLLYHCLGAVEEDNLNKFFKLLLD